MRPKTSHRKEPAETPGGNYNRLDAITYPDPLGGGNPRVLTFGYGTAGSVDALISRLTAINDSTQDATPIAAYTYAGTLRRIATT